MSPYLSPSLRKLVAERARFRCEYCLFPEAFSYFTFHIDHIVSLKHGGSSDPGNLAYACSICNRNKGTDLGTFVEGAPGLIRFFHPRQDRWSDHFSCNAAGVIHPLSKVGEATLKILDFNHGDSVLERRLLIEANIYSVS